MDPEPDQDPGIRIRVKRIRIRLSSFFSIKNLILNYDFFLLAYYSYILTKIVIYFLNKIIFLWYSYNFGWFFMSIKDLFHGFMIRIRITTLLFMHLSVRFIRRDSFSISSLQFTRKIQTRISQRIFFFLPIGRNTNCPWKQKYSQWNSCFEIRYLVISQRLRKLLEICCL